MSKFLVGVAAATAALGMASGATAHPPTHLHCLTTPSGKTHAIARGVTYHAPHLALENFHFHVHRPVFGVSGAGPMNTPGKHPLGPIPINLPFDPENPPC
jgi:hypothetical protein